MLWFKKKTNSLSQQSLEDRLHEIKKSALPKHVAIIMDGNGRWAKNKLLPRIAGHREGMENIRIISRFANKLGLKALTLYAFSTENWKRSKEEVSYLMKLPEEFLEQFLPELMELNMRVISIGEIGLVPDSTQQAIQNAAEVTKNNTGLILNFAFNYGSRAEMLIAMNQLVEDAKNGLLDGPVTEEIFSSKLFTAELEDPDLLIRTSGELRLSNFLLWQLAYTEFYFTETLWPEFLEEDFLMAIEDFQRRERRLGGRIGEGEDKH
ncbi:MAG: isoprenyl transferase [Bacillales bacterium]|nr:isoprenyl transferase [Bacillales bacterium]